MKRLIVITLASLMILSLSACATKTMDETVKGESSRMVRIEEAGIYEIVYDKETRVMYAVSYGVKKLRCVHSLSRCGRQTVAV